MANKITVTSTDQLESIFPELEDSARYSEGKKFKRVLDGAFKSGLTFDVVNLPKDSPEFFKAKDGRLYATLISRPGKGGTYIKKVDLNKNVVNSTGPSISATGWQQIAQVFGKLLGGTDANNELTYLKTCGRCGGTGKIDYVRDPSNDGTCWQCLGTGKFLEPKKGK